MLLPPTSSRADYSRVYSNNQIWLPAMKQIAACHGLVAEPLRQTLGSNIVFGFGNLIVKLFPPAGKDDFHTEQVALAFLRGRLPIPEIVAEGEIEGWPYFICTRLEGIPVAQVWPMFGSEQKRRFVWQLGEVIRSLHGSGIPAGLRDDWGVFLRQRLTSVMRHHNLPDPWRIWIADQLANFPDDPLHRVLLNGDLTPDHLLLTENHGTWSISGLIDFGDARVGHPYYDFIVPLLNFVLGEPGLAGVLLNAYGLTQSAETRGLLTKYLLLHEFATLGEYLERFSICSPEHFYQLLWG